MRMRLVHAFPTIFQHKFEINENILIRNSKIKNKIDTHFRSYFISIIKLFLSDLSIHLVQKTTFFFEKSFPQFFKELIDFKHHDR